jgi:hypothetical protein
MDTPETITVTDRPRHELASPLPSGVFLESSRRCPVCGKVDPVEGGIFRHRCRLEFAG